MLYNYPQADIESIISVLRNFTPSVLYRFGYQKNKKIAESMMIPVYPRSSIDQLKRRSLNLDGPPLFMKDLGSNVYELKNSNLYDAKIITETIQEKF